MILRLKWLELEASVRKLEFWSIFIGSAVGLDDCGFYSEICLNVGKLSFKFQLGVSKCQ